GRLVTPGLRQIDGLAGVGPGTGAVPDGFGRRRELELDVRLQLLVVAALLEGLLGDRERRASIVAVVANAGEVQQRLGALRTRGRRRDGLFQIRRGFAELPRLERELASVDRPVDPLLGEIGR